MKKLFVVALSAAALSLAAPAAAGVTPAPSVVEVYKSATCGCCTKWVEHLKSHGFKVKTNDVANPSSYRAKFGVPDRLGSCHTALVEGYVIEGHVPAREIQRLLTERPRAKGLAVPGMPLGSPGMEGPRSDPYEVLLLQTDGKHTVYQKYGK